MTVFHMHEPDDVPAITITWLEDYSAIVQMMLIIQDPETKEIHNVLIDKEWSYHLKGMIDRTEPELDILVPKNDIKYDD